MSAAKLANIMRQDLGYNEDGKAAFHKEAKAVLRKVAKALKLAPSDYDLRSNKGGIAVSGEVTLHTDKLYITVEQSCGGGPAVMYRTCEGRKDYTGGPNNWASASDLLDDNLLAQFERMQTR